MLENAIQIAISAHYGQRCKAGKHYILHPLRVMFKMKKEEDQIVAVLHDVIEDSNWTLQNLKIQGFGKRVIRAVELLTRKINQSYHSYVKTIKRNELATRVKLADLEDNMDPDRLELKTEKDFKRIKKYQRAYVFLGGRL